MLVTDYPGSVQSRIASSVILLPFFSFCDEKLIFHFGFLIFHLAKAGSVIDQHAEKAFKGV